MDSVVMLCGAEPRKILQAVVAKKVPVIMSYVSRGRRHIAKVVMCNLGVSMIEVEVSPRNDRQPININIGQEVSVSLKYGYGKFVFETKVIDLKPSLNRQGGGIIELGFPQNIELIQRRSYYRVNIPKSIKVGAKLWYGSTSEINGKSPEYYWKGTLVDISAGGSQIAIEAEQKQNFREGQPVVVQFTPMPYEEPIIFDSQIRKVLPTADGESICLGLQIVGLETSVEGRKVLQRLCETVERYHQMNQFGVKQQEFQEAI